MKYEQENFIGENLEKDPLFNVLKTQFISSIDRIYVDDRLLQTQEAAIDESIQIIKSHAEDPLAVIESITSSYFSHGMRHEGELWIRMHELMEEAENVSDKRVVYSPYEFIASLKDFSEQEVHKYQVLEQQKVAAQRVKGISKEQRAILEATLATHLTHPAFLETIAENYLYDDLVDIQKGNHNDEYSAYLEQLLQQQIDAYERYITGQISLPELHGVMRSNPSCDAQSLELYRRLRFDNLILAEGSISPTLYTHTILIAGEDKATVDLLVAAQSEYARKTNHSPRAMKSGLFAAQAMQDESMPLILDLTVIDPSIIQVFESNPFLIEMEFKDRISFVKDLSPHTFSDEGVFIGRYEEYIRFLGLLGHYEPVFQIVESHQVALSLKEKANQSGHSKPDDDNSGTSVYIMDQSS